MKKYKKKKKTRLKDKQIDAQTDTCTTQIHGQVECSDTAESFFKSFISKRTKIQIQISDLFSLLFRFQKAFITSATKLSPNMKIFLILTFFYCTRGHVNTNCTEEIAFTSKQVEQRISVRVMNTSTLLANMSPTYEKPLQTKSYFF